jgi:plasmid stabilization system protein ParE
MQASRRVVEALSNAFAALAQNPDLGERRDDVAPGLRAFSPRRPAHSYVILYYETNDGVEISAVTHGARDWPKLFTSGDR